MYIYNAEEHILDDIYILNAEENPLSFNSLVRQHNGPLIMYICCHNRYFHLNHLIMPS